MMVKIKNLTKFMNRLGIQSSPKSRPRRRRNRRVNRQPNRLPTLRRPRQRRRLVRRRNVRAVTDGYNSGISRTITSKPDGEFWFSTVGDATGTIKTQSFNPGSTGMLVLDGTAKIYDNYRIKNLTIFLKGKGTAMSTANVVACVDFDPKKSPTTRDMILQMQPSTSLMGLQEDAFHLKGKDVMRRNMFVSNSAAADEDATAFNITYSAMLPDKDTTVWQVWVKYDIEFIHPAPLNS